MELASRLSTRRRSDRSAPIVAVLALVAATFAFSMPSATASERPFAIPQIANGIDAPAAPSFMVRVLKRSTNGTYRPACTGTLISARWVVTAAHCVDGSALRVEIGRLDVDDTATGIERDIVSTIRDARWEALVAAGNDCLDGVCNYDIALLELDTAVPSSWEVAPMLASATPPGGGENVLYRGYGRTASGGYASTLQQTQPGDFTFAGRCGAAPLDQLVCLERSGDATLQNGDSGGPWFVERDEWVFFAVHDASDGDAVATLLQDAAWVREAADVPHYPPGTVLVDQAQAASRWLVVDDGYRVPIADSTLQCLVASGAPVVTAPMVDISSVALRTSDGSCNPGVGDPTPATFLVGAPSEHAGAPDSGALTVLRIDETANALGSVRLSEGSAPIGGAAEPGDGFGTASAMGDLNGDGLLDVVVGTPGEDLGGATDTGAVTIVFDALGTSTTSVRIDQGTDGIPGAAEAGDRWGAAVAVADLDGDGYDDLVIGAPGEDIGSIVDAGTVTIVAGGEFGIDLDRAIARHQGSPGVPGANETGDAFGASLAVFGGAANQSLHLAVGSPGEAIGSIAAAGAVTVFTLDANGTPLPDPALLYQGAGASGTRPAMPGGSETGDGFGSVLAGNELGLLAIGAPAEDIGSIADAGAVTLYQRAVNDGRATATMIHQGSATVPGVNETGDRFGTAVAVGSTGSQHTLVVGAPTEDIGSVSDAGVVWSFHDLRVGSTLGTLEVFHQGQAQVPGTNRAGDNFGAVIQEDAGALLVSAPGRTIGSIADAGIAIVFFGPANDRAATNVIAVHQNSPDVPGQNDPGDRWGS